MQKGRDRKGRKKVEARQQPTPSTHDELSEEADSLVQDNPMEKDQTELELEKLVFGDDKGFREGLGSYEWENGDVENGMGSAKENTASEDGVAEEQDFNALEDADLFFLDSGPSTSRNQDLMLTEAPGEDNADSKDVDPPAWIDSDDERITVSLASNSRLRKLRISETEDLVNGKEYAKRLRQEFERLYPVPEWANPSASKQSASRRKRQKLSNETTSSEDDPSADDMSDDSNDISTQPLAKLLQSTTPLIEPALSTTSTRKQLRPEVIDIQRTKDVAGVQPSAITSLSFHPSTPLLLSSGPSSTLTLTHISPTSPQPNPVLHTLHVSNTPLTTSAFSPLGSRIFFSSRRRYFHVWDLPSGHVSKISRIYGHAAEQRSMERFKLSTDGRWMGLVGSGRKGGGVVNVLDAGTCQWVCQARVEGKGGVADFAWWGDGDGLLIIGKGGQAVEYSMQERRVVGRWTDEGAVGTTVVALGGKSKAGLGGDRWCVVGSQSGIVNVYDRSGWRAGAVPERPKPAKTLTQLVTPTSYLLFSPDGQMFVMTSRWKRDALRLVHLPSCTVYKNWPTANTPLGRITAVAISPSSELLAVANEQGKIRLWEIRS